MKKEKYHFRKEVIELLKNKVPYKEIVKKYGVSKRYLYNLKAMKFGRMKISSKKYFDNLYNEINLCFTSIKLAYYKTILICRENRCANEYFPEIWLAETIWIMEKLIEMNYQRKSYNS